ncbi:MAG: hypothetical protein GY865_19955, partial [candidate division Zixibacteria bacterium]|nr:hypothetical protein [candidate division Zixibacteria bacterium]
ANDLITGFVYSKAIRYNILSGTAARLISGDFIIDLTSVFNDELDHGRCTAVEKSRLIKSAIDLEIRGLNKSISKCTDRSNKELVRLSRKYLKKIKEVSLPDLNIKLLGQFTALSKGKLLPIKRKKSKMLFQILLIEHPRPIHEEKIIEFLWPDSNLSKGKSILQTSVGDLRKALDPLYEPRGKSYIKYTNQQYYLELPDGSQIDTFIFEDTLKKGMISIDKNYVFDDSSEKEINRALGMYKGELIPEQRYEDYSIEYGERLQKLYLDGILAFSKYLYKKNRYDEGITVLRNGLKLDPLWGQGVEQLMKIQVKNDNLFQAMKTYRNYEKLLKKELDLSPDREISYFFNDIIRQINNI